MTSRPKMLLVFDGGLAPGYTAVGVGMTEEGEERGYEVWASHEGFRSLTGDTDQPIRLERVVMQLKDVFELDRQNIHAQHMYRKIDDPGCDFRSERYREFREAGKSQLAARFIEEHGFTHVTFAGGDGTLAGAKAICEHLDKDIKVGFINCSADSDLAGDRSVGFLSALEEGARVARGLFEDAYTHKRHYILEMMGNRGGKHALHCGCSARAHLIVLPQMNLSDEILKDIAEQLSRESHSLTVIAEGYKKDERRARFPGKSASQQLAEDLARFGLVDSPKKRVIAESFSRFIRGAPPLMMECELAYLKCQLLYKAFERGESRILAYYVGEHEHGTRPLAEVHTDNGVEPLFIDMIDRVGIPSLRKHAHEVYG
ncbi:MAG: 6-phosphofructokinase [Myxococcota bacterium]